jgi:hypothetical protein
VKHVRKRREVQAQTMDNTRSRGDQGIINIEDMEYREYGDFKNSIGVEAARFLERERKRKRERERERAREDKLKLNSVVLVHKRTIPTERPQPAGEVSANFS